MKRLLLFLACTMMAAAMLTACSSSRYVIVTNDFASHIAYTKPVIDAATDTIVFEDENGNQVNIPRNQMKEIKEIKD